MDTVTRKFASRRAAAPLAGRITVPGDKSISHRALMFGALAIGETRITGLLEGEDVLRTAAAMRALGAEVTHDADGTWRVAGRGVGGLVEPADVLDMGNSGTAARLLCGMLASHPLFAVMTGDASLRRRPMRRVIDPLSACGARFAAREGGRLPLAVQGPKEALPLEYRVPVPSAQVKSAVLLCGLNAPGITRVEEPEATRDHTENMLRHFGATVHVEPAGRGRVITLQGQPELRAADVVVPGDPSSAAFLVAAALLVPGSRLTIAGVGLNQLRCGLYATLAEMGADIVVENRRVRGRRAGRRSGGRRTARCAASTCRGSARRRMIDEYPILAVIASHAAGTTRMRGLKELRVKESDRLAATAALLAVNGARVEIEGDDLIVHGDGRAAAGRRAGRDRYGPSHRHGGAGARGGDRAAGDGGRAGVHRHQLPRLRRTDEPCRRSVVAGVTDGPVIAIDGPAAAGKGTLARRIAAHLGCPTSTPACCIAPSDGWCWIRGGDPADPTAAEAAARALRPADLERDDLRGPVADAAAASVAAIPAVRAALLDFQRGFATARGAVLDGRDIGTVIFPDAPVKLYVTASLAERARRRWLELRAKGIAADLATVEAEMLARDTRDAPNMRRARDAHVLDTTTLDAEAAFERAVREVRERLEKSRQIN